MTGLPPNGTAWPPPGHAKRMARLPELDAWYSGDPAALEAVYGGGGAARLTPTTGVATTLNPTGRVKAALDVLRGRRLWSTPAASGRSRRHLPIASDIATTSADLLFSEPIRIEVLGPTYEADELGAAPADGGDAPIVHAKGDPKPETLAAQDALDRIVERSGGDSLWLAAAETCAALGYVGLRIGWGDGAEGVSISRQDADAVLPEYEWGRLVAVTLWSAVEVDGDTILRWLERHEPGRIYHGLYRGTRTTLGMAVPLTDSPKTAPLAKLVDEQGSIATGVEGLAATSVPNMLPDALDRRSDVGRSDYTASVIDLLDAGDGVYSDWLDAVDDAKSRIILSESMVTNSGPGQGAAFDMSQRVIMPVKMPPSETPAGKGLPIEQVQFDMHTDEYLKGIDAIAAKALDAAGYTPTGTNTDAAGRDVTATEVVSNDRKSVRTRDKKIRYWRPRLEALLTTALQLEVARFQPRVDGTLVQAYPVRVTFPDTSQPTQAELAATAKALYDAKSASTETRVRIVQPEWTDVQVKEEAARIDNGERAVDPFTIGVGGEGMGPGDGL